MHDQARTWLSATRGKIAETGNVLEVGSHNHNGTCRDYYQSPDIPYVGVDIIPGPGVDVVGDINNEQFRNFLVSTYGTFQTIMSTETLEHTPAEPLLTAMLRLLNWDAPSCRLVLTCANKARPVHGHDGGPLKENEHYGNVSEQEVIDCVRSFVETREINKTHHVFYDVPLALDQMDTYAYIEFVRK
jgi:hypothetical protein